MASWLSARSKGGRWLVRIEDIDRPRVVPGAAAGILASLRRYGLYEDGEVVYQSERTALYETALRSLEERGLVYACGCSRADLQRAASAPAGGELVYPGICRAGIPGGRPPRAWRFRVPEGTVVFDDLASGRVEEDVAITVGDFVVRRADGLFAYQLAVVVDDASQGVTEVVRGADLLGSTARQILLQEALDYRRPQYTHVPLMVTPDGIKLSKRDGALALPELDEATVVATLRVALEAIGLRDLPARTPDALLAAALGLYEPSRFSKKPHVVDLRRED